MAKVNKYWAERMAKAQTAISEKSARAIKMQLNKYYMQAMDSVVREFAATYDKLIYTVGSGKEAVPADLYKLEKYWKMQGHLQEILNKLGSKQARLYAAAFEINFFDVYYSITVEGLEAFNTLDTATVRQMINQVWVADGKSWSDRIWANTKKLAETLNEELIQCVLTGKTTSELKHKLQTRFNVSFNNADMIARTELAHIQTQAAQKRYQDYGIEQVEVLVDEDERTCKICAKHEGERHFVNEQMPVPFHPRCRCCVIPVVE
jgi:SPP1 gp7 family putative phage head morphogenesis protein